MLALQLGVPAHPLNDGEPPVQEIQYRAYAHPPPCGHGWDRVQATACAIRPALFARGIKRRDNTSIAGIAATAMTTIHVAATTATIEGCAIEGGAILTNYLSIVGTLLKDGHFKQAKIRALQAKEYAE